MQKRLVRFATATMLAVLTICSTAFAREQQDRAEPSANQISDRAAARSARLKADLRLTSDQEKNWAGFDTAVKKAWANQAERQVAWRNAHADQNANIDMIEEMRKDADQQIEHANDRKKLADGAAPLYQSLDDQQKRRFSEVLFGGGRHRRRD